MGKCYITGSLGNEWGKTRWNSVAGIIYFVYRSVTAKAKEYRSGLPHWKCLYGWVGIC